MRILGLVPARGGSARLPRKNLLRVGGTTLVRRALGTALACERFATVALSSDDDEILAEARGLDVRPIRRPPELATDRALALDAVLHALDVLEEPFDAVGIVQATSPLTAPDDLAGAVDLFERSGAGSVVSVAPVLGGRHPLKLKLLDGDRLRPWLADDAMAPSHALPELWARNGSIYLTRAEALRRGEILDENDQRGYRMPSERSVDVDTPLDLAWAEFLLGRAS